MDFRLLFLALLQTVLFEKKLNYLLMRHVLKYKFICSIFDVKKHLTLATVLYYK